MNPVLIYYGFLNGPTLLLLWWISSSVAFVFQELKCVQDISGVATLGNRIACNPITKYCCLWYDNDIGTPTNVPDRKHIYEARSLPGEGNEVYGSSFYYSSLLPLDSDRVRDIKNCHRRSRRSCHDDGARGDAAGVVKETGAGMAEKTGAGMAEAAGAGMVEETDAASLPFENVFFEYDFDQSIAPEERCYISPNAGIFNLLYDYHRDSFRKGWDTTVLGVVECDGARSREDGSSTEESLDDTKKDSNGFWGFVEPLIAPTGPRTPKNPRSETKNGTDTKLITRPSPLLSISVTSKPMTTTTNAVIDPTTSLIGLSRAVNGKLNNDGNSLMSESATPIDKFKILHKRSEENGRTINTTTYAPRWSENKTSRDIEDSDIKIVTKPAGEQVIENSGAINTTSYAPQSWENVTSSNAGIRTSMAQKPPVVSSQGPDPGVMQETTATTTTTTTRPFSSSTSMSTAVAPLEPEGATTTTAVPVVPTQPAQKTNNIRKLIIGGVLVGGVVLVGAWSAAQYYSSLEREPLIAPTLSPPLITLVGTTKVEGGVAVTASKSTNNSSTNSSTDNSSSSSTNNSSSSTNNSSTSKGPVRKETGMVSGIGIDTPADTAGTTPDEADRRKQYAISWGAAIGGFVMFIIIICTGLIWWKCKRKAPNLENDEEDVAQI